MEANFQEDQLISACNGNDNVEGLIIVGKPVHLTYPQRNLKKVKAKISDVVKCLKLRKVAYYTPLVQQHDGTIERPP